MTQFNIYRYTVWSQQWNFKIKCYPDPLAIRLTSKNKDFHNGYKFIYVWLYSWCQKIHFQGIRGHYRPWKPQLSYTYFSKLFLLCFQYQYLIASTAFNISHMAYSLHHHSPLQHYIYNIWYHMNYIKRQLELRSSSCFARINTAYRYLVGYYAQQLFQYSS